MKIFTRTHKNCEECDLTGAKILEYRISGEAIAVSFTVVSSGKAAGRREALRWMKRARH